MKTTLKTKKKPVKKEIVKQLIEGKYSHKFLTRLDPIEGKALDAIIQKESIKGYCNAVTLAVMSYQKMKDEISELRTSLNQQQQKNGDMIDTLTDYIEISKKLHSFKMQGPKLKASEFMCSKCFGNFPDYEMETHNHKNYCEDCYASFEL